MLGSLPSSLEKSARRELQLPERQLAEQKRVNPPLQWNLRVPSTTSVRQGENPRLWVAKLHHSHLTDGETESPGRTLAQSHMGAPEW